MKIKQNHGDRILVIFMYALVIGFAVVCLYPMLMAVSVSFSDEQTVALNGYSLIPEKFSTFAYEYFLKDKGAQMANAYGVTLFVLVLGTALAILTTVCYAYASSVKTCKASNFLSFFAFFTMLFNGGMLPWYILCTRYYHLNNTIWGLILPSVMNVFNMYLMRNFFKTIPIELAESARVDGAGQLTIFVRIMLPLAKVGIVTVTLFYALGYWNDWYLALMLITNEKLYPVQYLLYMMISNAQYIATGANAYMTQNIVVPMQTMQMAMTCIAVGPIIFVYPLAQKYFVKGVTLGAVKG